jgi:cell division protein FtsX
MLPGLWMTVAQPACSSIMVFVASVLALSTTMVRAAFSSWHRRNALNAPPMVRAEL